MTIEEIEAYIDSKNDEDTCDTILSESAFKEANEATKAARERLPSKQDSGIESSGHDDVDNGDLDSVQNDNCMYSDVHQLSWIFLKACLRALIGWL